MEAGPLDESDGPEGDLSQVLYLSRATEPMSKSDLSALLEEIRERNERKEITGLLLYGGQHFYQILEGARSAVTTTYAEIEGDRRHTDITRIAIRAVAERKFPRWWMGFQSLNPEEIKNNPVFHDLRNSDTLAKFPARGDEFFEVMYAMYKTNN